jgi:hypothetical protein
MKIVAVRIGDRYGPEYESYLEKGCQTTIYLDQRTIPCRSTDAMEQDVGYELGY